ncbi:FAD-binding oxidoreductase [Nocardia brevicatena]|uniref:FAD-binding oxidoreductase n=1 Tax=Nocardia brevicatena TaxID=37327 RepID=UPI00030177F8|nr:FAD-binding oxidoreductase [Nocardia brevicatena]
MGHIAAENTELTAAADAELAAFPASVSRPGTDGYERETTGFQTAYRHRPAVVVEARHTEDVRAAVEFAARYELPVAVQATGHGLSVAADGGVLISTRGMTGIEIDPVAASARIGAGVRAGALIEAAARHGLAPLNGSSPSVGVVGYVLGGGVGLLARKYGYAADHVRAAELVTADGRVRTLRPGDELFGAVLGSGGNFGVVTALELDLVPVTSVYGGQLVFDAPLVPRALEMWREWTATLPDAVTSTFTMSAFPDIPQVPAPLRGRFAASVRIAAEGDTEECERLVAPLRAIGTPLKDDLRVMPYTESHTIHSDPDHPHAYAATNALLDDLTPEAVEALLTVAGPDAGPGTVIDIRHLGGVLREPCHDGLALDHRAAGFVVRAITMPGPDPEPGEPAAAVRAALAPWTVGHNLGFLYGAGHAADEAQTRAGYRAETYARLAALKSVHDPKNMFRFNRNIRPAA